MTRIRTLVVLLVIAVVVVHRGFAQPDNGSILRQLSPVPTLAISTIPANGDLNPYGVAFVPAAFPGGGTLNPGDILVSNFNASSNLQGTGTTIVKIDSSGQQALFFQAPSGMNVGLTTALAVLSSGFVLVGNVPTTTPRASCTQKASGQETGVGQGSVLILDRQGHLVGALRNRQFLDGPWDLAVRDSGAAVQVFVSNVLAGTVTRLDLALESASGTLSVTATTQIASGYTHRCDPNALVVGPTGVAFDAVRDTLFVASTGDNAIFAVPNAGTTTTDHGPGTPFINDPAHLHGPLALTEAQNGHLITSQGDAVNPDPHHPSEIVEYSVSGQFVAQFSIDSAAGSAFGLALVSSEHGFRFAAVDDATNVLDIWVVR
jgi:hypothetical protein